MSKKLTLNDMQGMLPDYVFGKLDETEKADFEQNLPHFPQLQDEIKQTNRSFAGINPNIFNAQTAQYTRNISVKVNHILETKNPKQHKKMLKHFGITATTAIVACCAIVFGIYNQDLPDISNDNPAKAKSNVTKTIEATGKSQDVAEKNIIKNNESVGNEVRKNIVKPLNRKVLQNMQQEIGNSPVKENTDLTNIEENDVMVDNYYSFYSCDLSNYTDEMSNDQFNNFIKELSHEDD